MRNLILILGDQLSPELSALRGADPAQDEILMAEVADEASYTNHHKKKLVLIFSAMRHFASDLEAQGFRVHYQRYDPQSRLRSLEAVVADARDRLQPQALITTACGEWRLYDQIRRWQTRLGLPVAIREDDRFLCSVEDFTAWAQGRKQLRMEYFYRDMRKRTGYLIDADGNPEGGHWNYDPDNRRKWTGEPAAPPPYRAEPDALTEEVIALVEACFSDHFGSLEGFHFAVTRDQARAALAHFVAHGLPCFGDYQDAMATGEDELFHSLLSPYLNIGLLGPQEVCEAAIKAYREGQAPLNAVEGFVRQIIGWREFVRGIYWLEMPDYARENRLGNQRDLPWFYWSGDTGMHCLSQCINGTRRNAYAHHIQRLMVTGNFALIYGVIPDQICDWYLAVYADAFDWVELPNTLGMVMHADAGLLGSKPYAASGKYIQRMSDYCGQCRYKVSATTGDDACPFNSLYWHFIDRHRRQFARNPRMALVYRNWDRQAPEKRKATLARAEWVIDHIDEL